MPFKGDPLFTVSDGQLVKYTFLREKETEPFFKGGKSSVVWIIQKPGQGPPFTQCSPSMYKLTEREAWQKYLDEVKDGIKHTVQTIKDSERTLMGLIGERGRVLDLLVEDIYISDKPIGY
jgi:hypothetical protein